MTKYPFVTVRTNSGSSLILRWLGTSQHAITLPREGQSYFRPGPVGQGIDDCKRLWTEKERSFIDRRNYAWGEIKGRWARIWHRRNPQLFDAGSPVLVEKSPPNVLRAFMLQDEFFPSYFLVGIRNPYAFVEGVVRRMHSEISLKRAITHWVRCAEWQCRNMQ